jgi:hypothetical protein
MENVSQYGLLCKPTYNRLAKPTHPILTESISSQYRIEVFMHQILHSLYCHTFINNYADLFDVAAKESALNIDKSLYLHGSNT